MNEFIFNTSTKNLNNDTFTIGASKNGTKKYGFNTIGVPNNTGSFMLNKLGIIANLPNCLYCADFANTTIITVKARVSPEPAKLIKLS